MSSTCGGGFGNHVILLHAGGMATLYAHLGPDGTRVRSGSVGAVRSSATAAAAVARRAAPAAECARA
jgi:murein DD-endopeptidase MepM/ murein hydrolase activator NlpD